VSSPIWGSWPDIYCCLTVTVLFLWGTLSDERTGLSFVYAAGPCQRSLSQVKSLGTCDHILLPPIWDLPFRRLLRLTGSRWRYSTLPPHGYPLTLESIMCHLFITRDEPNRDHHLEQFVYYLVSICCYKTCVNFATTLWFLQGYPLLRISALASRCLAMDYSGFQTSCHNSLTFSCWSQRKMTNFFVSLYKWKPI
jgi:hypothetical protein